MSGGPALLDNEVIIRETRPSGWVLLFQLPSYGVPVGIISSIIAYMSFGVWLWMYDPYVHLNMSSVPLWRFLASFAMSFVPVLAVVIYQTLLIRRYRYICTNLRFVVTGGVFTRFERSYSYEAMTGLERRQTAFERFLGLSRVYIYFPKEDHVTRMFGASTTREMRPSITMLGLKDGAETAGAISRIISSLDPRETASWLN